MSHQTNPINTIGLSEEMATITSQNVDQNNCPQNTTNNNPHKINNTTPLPLITPNNISTSDDYNTTIAITTTNNNPVIEFSSEGNGGNGIYLMEDYIPANLMDGGSSFTDSYIDGSFTGSDLSNSTSSDDDIDKCSINDDSDMDSSRDSMFDHVSIDSIDNNGMYGGEIDNISTIPPSTQVIEQNDKNKHSNNNSSSPSSSFNTTTITPTLPSTPPINHSADISIQSPNTPLITPNTSTNSITSNGTITNSIISISGGTTPLTSNNTTLGLSHDGLILRSTPNDNMILTTPMHTLVSIDMDHLTTMGSTIITTVCTTSSPLPSLGETGSSPVIVNNDENDNNKTVIVNVDSHNIITNDQNNNDNHLQPQQHSDICSSEAFTLISAMSSQHDNLSQIQNSLTNHCTPQSTRSSRHHLMNNNQSKEYPSTPITTTMGSLKSARLHNNNNYNNLHNSLTPAPSSRSHYTSRLSNHSNGINKVNNRHNNQSNRYHTHNDHYYSHRRLPQQHLNHLNRLSALLSSIPTPLQYEDLVNDAADGSQTDYYYKHYKVIYDNYQNKGGIDGLSEKRQQNDTIDDNDGDDNNNVSIPRLNRLPRNSELPTPKPTSSSSITPIVPIELPTLTFGLSEMGSEIDYKEQQNEPVNKGQNDDKNNNHNNHNNNNNNQDSSLQNEINLYNNINNNNNYRFNNRSIIDGVMRGDIELLHSYFHQISSIIAILQHEEHLTGLKLLNTNYNPLNNSSNPGEMNQNGNNNDWVGLLLQPQPQSHRQNDESDDGDIESNNSSTMLSSSSSSSSCIVKITPSSHHSVDNDTIDNNLIELHNQYYIVIQQMVPFLFNFSLPRREWYWMSLFALICIDNRVDILRLLSVHITAAKLLVFKSDCDQRTITNNPTSQSFSDVDPLLSLIQYRYWVNYWDKSMGSLVAADNSSGNGNNHLIIDKTQSNTTNPPPQTNPMSQSPSNTPIQSIIMTSSQSDINTIQQRQGGTGDVTDNSVVSGRFNTCKVTPLYLALYFCSWGVVSCLINRFGQVNMPSKDENGNDKVKLGKEVKSSNQLSSSLLSQLTQLSLDQYLYIVMDYDNSNNPSNTNNNPFAISETLSSITSTTLNHQDERNSVESMLRSNLHHSNYKILPALPTPSPKVTSGINFNPHGDDDGEIFPVSPVNSKNNNNESTLINTLVLFLIQQPTQPTESTVALSNDNPTSATIPPQISIAKEYQSSHQAHKYHHHHQQQQNGLKKPFANSPLAPPHLKQTPSDNYYPRSHHHYQHSETTITHPKSQYRQSKQQSQQQEATVAVAPSSALKTPLTPHLLSRPSQSSQSLHSIAQLHNNANATENGIMNTTDDDNSNDEHHLPRYLMNDNESHKNGKNNHYKKQSKNHKRYRKDQQTHPSKSPSSVSLFQSPTSFYYDDVPLNKVNYPVISNQDDLNLLMIPLETNRDLFYLVLERLAWYSHAEEGCIHDLCQRYHEMAINFTHDENIEKNVNQDKATPTNDLTSHDTNNNNELTNTLSNNNAQIIVDQDDIGDDGDDNDDDGDDLNSSLSHMELVDMGDWGEFGDILLDSNNGDNNKNNAETSGNTIPNIDNNDDKAPPHFDNPPSHISSTSSGFNNDELMTIALIEPTPLYDDGFQDSDDDNQVKKTTTTTSPPSTTVTRPTSAMSPPQPRPSLAQRLFRRARRGGSGTIHTPTEVAKAVPQSSEQQPSSPSASSSRNSNTPILTITSQNSSSPRLIPLSATGNASVASTIVMSPTNSSSTLSLQKQQQQQQQIPSLSTLPPSSFTASHIGSLSPTSDRGLEGMTSFKTIDIEQKQQLPLPPPQLPSLSTPFEQQLTDIRIGNNSYRGNRSNRLLITPVNEPISTLSNSGSSTHYNRVYTTFDTISLLFQRAEYISSITANNNSMNASLPSYHHYTAKVLNSNDNNPPMVEKIKHPVGYYHLLKILSFLLTRGAYNNGHATYPGELQRFQSHSDIQKFNYNIQFDPTIPNYMSFIEHFVTIDYAKYNSFCSTVMDFITKNTTNTLNISSTTPTTTPTTTPNNNNISNTSQQHPSPLLIFKQFDLLNDITMIIQRNTSTKTPSSQFILQKLSFFLTELNLSGLNLFFTHLTTTLRVEYDTISDIINNGTIEVDYDYLRQFNLKVSSPLIQPMNKNPTKRGGNKTWIDEEINITYHIPLSLYSMSLMSTDLIVLLMKWGLNIDHSVQIIERTITIVKKESFRQSSFFSSSGPTRQQKTETRSAQRVLDQGCPLHLFLSNTMDKITTNLSMLSTCTFAELSTHECSMAVITRWSDVIKMVVYLFEFLSQFSTSLITSSTFTTLITLTSHLDLTLSEAIIDIITALLNYSVIMMNKLNQPKINMDSQNEFIKKHLNIIHHSIIQPYLNTTLHFFTFNEINIQQVSMYHNLVGILGKCMNCNDQNNNSFFSQLKEWCNSPSDGKFNMLSMFYTITNEVNIDKTTYYIHIKDHSAIGHVKKPQLLSSPRPLILTLTHSHSDDKMINTSYPLPTFTPTSLLSSQILMKLDLPINQSYLPSQWYSKNNINLFNPKTKMTVLSKLIIADANTNAFIDHIVDLRKSFSNDDNANNFMMMEKMLKEFKTQSIFSLINTLFSQMGITCPPVDYDGNAAKLSSIQSNMNSIAITMSSNQNNHKHYQQHTFYQQQSSLSSLSSSSSSSSTFWMLTTPDHFNIIPFHYIINIPQPVSILPCLSSSSFTMTMVNNKHDKRQTNQQETIQMNPISYSFVNSSYLIHIMTSSSCQSFISLSTLLNNNNDNNNNNTPCFINNNNNNRDHLCKELMKSSYYQLHFIHPFEASLITKCAGE